MFLSLTARLRRVDCDILILPLAALSSARMMHRVFCADVESERAGVARAGGPVSDARPGGSGGECGRWRLRRQRRRARDTGVRLAVAVGGFRRSSYLALLAADEHGVARDVAARLHLVAGDGDLRGRGGGVEVEAACAVSAPRRSRHVA